jgi:hypothetical protein
MKHNTYCKNPSRKIRNAVMIARYHSKSKLGSASYAVRSVKPFLTINTLKMIYYSYFHSVITYGLLFWGNSPDSIKIFRLQKRLLELWQVADIEIHVENCLLT